MDTLLTITTNRQETSTTSVALDPQYSLCSRSTDKKDFTILFGDSEQVVSEVVTDIVSEIVGPYNVVNSVTTKTGDRLFELAESTQPKIVFIFLNNILFYTDKYQFNHRIEGVIQVIAEIRTKLGIPVIVYSGFEGYEPAVRAAGVEFYFKAPFGLEEFRAAIRATIDKYQL
ncbi:MAG: hypothetical protein IPH75_05205 [bacterium]|nr:hypothetical protein [bacterium]